jgi:hypothetical protein
MVSFVRRWASLLPALALAVTLAGCGHSRHQASAMAATTTTSTVSPLAPAYLSMADRANAQVAAAEAAIAAHADNLAAVRGYLRAIAGAKRSLDASLRRLTFPAAQAADVHTLLRADATLETLLDHGANAASTASLATVRRVILEAGDAAARAAAALRGDLGLPAPPPPA